MRESTIERYLRLSVKRAGGECHKLTKKRGWPDRLVLLPGAAMCFVETKASGKKAAAHQARVHARLWRMGFPTLIIDSKPMVDSFIQTFSKQSCSGGWIAPGKVPSHLLCEWFHKDDKPEVIVLHGDFPK